ncbi:hypothetical protein ADK77_04770 [Streptomyces antibioticus]|nr:hypothetical protein ADK77_04770 [Streptomyces antibioticus]
MPVQRFAEADQLAVERGIGALGEDQVGHGRRGPGRRLRLAVVAGGHPAVALPVHRIVALSGDRRRRGAGQVPAHEPVDER